MDILATTIGTVWDMFATTITQFNAYPVMWLATAIGVVGAMIGLVRRATRVGGSRRK